MALDVMATFVTGLIFMVPCVLLVGLTVKLTRILVRKPREVFHESEKRGAHRLD